MLGKCLFSNVLINLSDSLSALVTGVLSCLISIGEFIFFIIILAAFKDISAIMFFISTRF